MNLVALALNLTLAAAPAEAGEGATPAPLTLKPKAAIVAAAPGHRSAPFVEPLGEPELAVLTREDPRMETSRSSCSGRSSLCYDTQSGRIVYKPARALMPAIPGLRPENISVKRDRIVLRYSF